MGGIVPSVTLVCRGLCCGIGNACVIGAVPVLKDVLLVRGVRRCEGAVVDRYGLAVAVQVHLVLGHHGHVVVGESHLGAPCCLR